ncbi:hypothetical protein BDM02DRAFT_2648708 [Thelephora ganbajun]|uniref:Uncharacterized protein n=1 Tax=Thelephora ganbajun TaxID=370292 RepID=A0ACB6ZDA2_THEGA|nr:hypothetical protein BDM02DRAFT_2648708 [Thelephora ganbajun]
MEATHPEVPTSPPSSYQHAEAIAALPRDVPSILPRHAQGGFHENRGLSPNRSWQDPGFHVTSGTALSPMAHDFYCSLLPTTLHPLPPPLTIFVDERTHLPCFPRTNSCQVSLDPSSPVSNISPPVVHALNLSCTFKESGHLTYAVALVIPTINGYSYSHSCSRRPLH